MVAGACAVASTCSISPAAKSTLLVHPEPERPTNRLNDGKVAPDGAFWAGTMDDRPEKENVGALYRLGADHRSQRMAAGVKVSNGLAWSPDGRVIYHSDSRAGTIWRYAHDMASGATRRARGLRRPCSPTGADPTAAPSMPRAATGAAASAPAASTASVHPASCSSWIELPVTHPTMPCFGGPDLKTLFITSLRENFSAEQLAATPLAGGVFAARLDVAGTPVARYRG